MWKGMQKMDHSVVARRLNSMSIVSDLSYVLALIAHATVQTTDQGTRQDHR